MSVQQHLMPYATTFVGTPVDPTAVIATLASTWNLITKAARRKVQLVWMHSVSKWLFLHHFVTITTSGTSLSLFSPTKISYIFHNIGTNSQNLLCQNIQSQSLQVLFIHKRRCTWFIWNVTVWLLNVRKAKLNYIYQRTRGEKQTEAMEQTTVYYIKVPLHWATPNLQTAATLCIYAL